MLKQNRLSDNLLNVITDFLLKRKQRIASNGHYSSWTNVEAGFPQGSFLGLFFFLIYINDLSDGLTPNLKLFAYDSSLLPLLKI